MIIEFMLCRMSLRCSALYLAQFRSTSPHILANGDGTNSATVTGDVYIHPSAKVHPTAKVILPKCLQKLLLSDFSIVFVITLFLMFSKAMFVLFSFLLANMEVLIS